jgi:hypothetical protein
MPLCQLTNRSKFSPTRIHQALSQLQLLPALGKLHADCAFPFFPERRGPAHIIAVYRNYCKHEASQDQDNVVPMGRFITFVLHVYPCTLGLAAVRN